jgi:hypothetical protein
VLAYNRFAPRRARVNLTLKTTLVCLATAIVVGQWIVLQARPSPVTLSPPEGVIPETYFGMHIHRATTTTPWPEIPFGSWRLWDAAVNWLKLQPNRDEWKFETLDKSVELAERHRVVVLLTLGRTPQWASARPEEAAEPARGGAAPPENLADWRKYVRMVVTRYKGRIQAYEIWNEPNLRNFYSGSPEQMVVLAREAYSIIKEVDPAAAVLTPSATGPTGVPWLNRYFDLGGAEYADIVGYHFYIGAAPPEAMLERIEQVKRVMVNHNVRKALWNTETGCCFPAPKSFDSEQEKSAYVARAYVLNWAAGVRRFYWYAWDNQKLSIPLTKSDDSEVLPAALAYAEVQKWLVGAQMHSCASDARGTWTCQLTRDSGSREWILWNPDRKFSLDVPLDWGVHILRRLDGEQRELGLGARVDVDFQPVLLETGHR